MLYAIDRITSALDLIDGYGVESGKISGATAMLEDGMAHLSKLELYQGKKTEALVSATGRKDQGANFVKEDSDVSE